MILPSATLHFVGWVEPISGYVGFRFTQPAHCQFDCVMRNPTMADFRTTPENRNAGDSRISANRQCAEISHEPITDYFSTDFIEITSCL
jgi:hypothetical protein